MSIHRLLDNRLTRDRLRSAFRDRPSTCDGDFSGGQRHDSSADKLRRNADSEISGVALEPRYELLFSQSAKPNQIANQRLAMTPIDLRAIAMELDVKDHSWIRTASTTLVIL
jgi:hypothetical protein